MNYSPEQVVVGFHTHGMVHHAFCSSLARAVGYEGRRIHSVISLPSPYTEEARNKIVDAFLADPQPVEYLLMVDCDIEFEKDAISKTMFIARHINADVVWGNYSLGTFSNSIFRKHETTDMGVALDKLGPYQIVPGVYAGGTGWCLMRRSLLLEMKEKYPGPWHWFDRDVVPDPENEGKTVRMGEDMGFGRRVWMMGNKLQVGYTGVHLQHHKTHSTAPNFMKPVFGAVRFMPADPDNPPPGIETPALDSGSAA